jgi:hypothetical protein
MRESASTQVEHWSGLVGRMLGDADIDKLAATTKALRRRRGVPDARALLRLALARGPGGLSLRETAASLLERLHQSCEFLAAVAATMLRVKAPGSDFRWPGRVIRISDGTCVSKPGSKGTDWRVHAVYDLGAGGFSHFDVTDAHGGEAIDRGAAIPGEIRLGDRNYATARGLRSFVESAGKDAKADYVARLRWSSLRLSTPERAKFDLVAHMRNMKQTDKRIDDVDVLIEGAGDPMPARLVVFRKPEEAARAERERLERLARKNGKALDERSLLAAEFIVLVTSLLALIFPAEQVLAMYRLRWQIELAFKRLKTLLHLDRLPARTAKGALSWIWAHLILAIAIDEQSQDFLEFSTLDMLDLRYAPSLWRAHKFVIRILLVAVLGDIAIEALLTAGPRFHRLLAEPPRKRKKQVQYPLRTLS